MGCVEYEKKLWLYVGSDARRQSGVLLSGGEGAERYAERTEDQETRTAGSTMGEGTPRPAG